MFGKLCLLVFGATLFVPVIRSQVCDTAVDDDDGRRFRSVSTGLVRQCQTDFVFEVPTNGCGACGILKIGYAMSDPCQADVEITFEDRTVRDTSQFTWLQSSNVGIRSNVEGSTNGFVGVFDGETSSIQIPLFEHSELGARLEIKLRYRESRDLDNTRLDMALLSNNAENAGVFPTFVILHSMQQNAALVGINTTGGIFRSLNVPITDSMRNEWKTVVFEYNAMATDGITARLSLEGPSFTTATDQVIGNIQSLRTPLVIGQSAFFTNFKGELDYIRISRCSPVVGSSIS